MPLERKPQRRLHDARRASRCNLTERRIHLSSCRIKPRRGINARELRMVQSVIHFPTQREETAFIFSRNLLDERHIHVAEAGSADNVLWSIARIANLRPGELGSIEPARKSLRTMIQLSRAGNHNARTIAAAFDIGSVRGAVANAARLATN